MLNSRTTGPATVGFVNTDSNEPEKSWLLDSVLLAILSSLTGGSIVGMSKSFDFTGASIGASSVPFSPRGEKLNISSSFLGDALTSWVGHEELDLAVSTVGFEATLTGSVLTSGTAGFVLGAFATGAFVTLVAGFVFGLELPKKESKSASAVEADWSPKLELVFETVCGFGVESLLALIPRLRCPKGFFFALEVVALATFFAGL